MMVTVEQIVDAGQLIESELRAQATRLKEVLPRDEDEAIYLTDLMAGYEQSAVYVNRLWTHQRKRLDKLEHQRAGTSHGGDVDEKGNAVAYTATDDSVAI